MTRAAVLILVLTATAQATPITDFQIGLNNNGFNTGGSVYIPIQSTGTNGRWKDEFVQRFIAGLKPKTGRHMDYWQVVTNDTTTWANREANDFGDKGLTYETTINIDNQALAINPNYTPWVNSPFFADEDHDEQLGFLYGQRFNGRKVIVGKGNEGWNQFGKNIPAQNLFLARSEEPDVPDFTASAHRWGRSLGKAVAAYQRGWVRAGRNANDVVMAVEGFAPATSWAQGQIDGMKAIGIDPKNFNAHVSIAQYAAGSDTDLTGPLGTPTEKRDALERFIDTLVGWTQQHRTLARANGLVDLVDAYEMRLGSHSPTADWIAFQGTPEMLEVQEYGWKRLVAASGGAAASMNIEGIIGFPWSFGIFSLADWPSQFNDPMASAAYAGTRAQIDFASIIPEPNFSVLGVVIAAALMASRRGRAA